MGPVRRILLASASPRRRALLEAACFAVEVRVPEVDETWPGGDIEAGAIALARRKLEAVSASDGLRLAADTMVVLDEQPLGKPSDADHAIEILSRLSGRTHRVVTGFCVRQGEHRREGVANTEVRFRPLSRSEIEHYVATREPFDKAGAYGIQGRGGALIDTVAGSYTNVVGLPLQEVLVCVDQLVAERAR